MNSDNTYEAKLAKIQAEREQLLATQRHLLGKERARVNKELARKRFVVGELVLSAITRDENLKTYLGDLLDQKLTRENDRKLFGLQPTRPTTTPQNMAPSFSTTPNA